MLLEYQLKMAILETFNLDLKQIPRTWHYFTCENFKKILKMDEIIKIRYKLGPYPFFTLFSFVMTNIYY